MSPLSAFMLYSPVSLQLLRLFTLTFHPESPPPLQLPRLSLDWKETNVNLSVWVRNEG